MSRSARHFDADLRDLGCAADGDIPLAASALRIALTEYPSLDPARWLGELDELARRARELGADDLPSRIEAVDYALFEDAGFRGNEDAYYDPRNSFLNWVLEHRTGIPITLSLVYVEVARRLGIPAEGVAFPGHFVVGIFSATGVELVDVFKRGTRLDDRACRELYTLQTGGAVAFDRSAIRPTPARRILVRMLTNLKGIYLRAGDYGRAISALDRILQVDPGEHSALRDRGSALLQMGEPARALRDLEAYLELVPEGDHTQVEKLMAAARRSIASFN
jgi:regulator of sirC expression with transglutaminase-like and TPR domain